MLFCKVLRVFHELLPVLEVLFCQVAPERVLWFGFVDKGDQRLDDLKAEEETLLMPVIKVNTFLAYVHHVLFEEPFSALTWSVLVAGFQFSAATIGRHTWPFSSTLGW